MSKKKQFPEFSEEQQKQYEREARLQYDPNLVNESMQRWNSYTKSQQETVKNEASQIYSEFAEALDAGLDARSPEVQQLAERWHDNIRHFYEPTLDILRGLGDLYTMSPDFSANFQKIHVDLPEYLKAAIVEYVDVLETAELERMLAEDDDMNHRQSRLSS